jgi:hypothetical protein
MSHLGDKLNLIICFTLLTWGISSCVGDTNETKKESEIHPNIIFITTDYQRGVDGPSLGSRLIKFFVFLFHQV